MKLTFQESRFIYRWFSYVLGKELTDGQYQQWQAGQFSSFFAYLAELGFCHEVRLIEQALAELRTATHPALELRADFAQLFLLDGQLSALPYASAYLPPTRLEAHLAQMDALLACYDLMSNRAYKEPSDHLLVYLTLLQKMAETDPLATRQHFLREQFLPWFIPFADKCVEVKTHYGFYTAVVRLLVQFVQKECDSV